MRSAVLFLCTAALVLVARGEDEGEVPGWKVRKEQRRLEDLADRVKSGDIFLRKAGTLNSPDFRLYFQLGREALSPWHDIPLRAGENGTFNMVVEIRRFGRAKMKVDNTLPYNPIRQDLERNGRLRSLHAPMYWNYGCLPQTWEDPTAVGSAEELFAVGDNDSLDILEVSPETLQIGEIVPVKVIGALALVDEGKLDWKLLSVRASHPNASAIHSVSDLDRVFPGTSSGIREWFRRYKTPSGAPLNQFGYGEVALGPEEAVTVVEAAHRRYQSLREGRIDNKWSHWLPLESDERDEL